MANARVAAGSLLDTVTKTANMVGSTVDTLASGIEMANSYVNRHRHMQTKRNNAELYDFDKRLQVELADRIAARNKEQERKLTDPVYAKHYEIAFNELGSIINPALPETAAS
jgi:hypothetical protein